GDGAGTLRTTPKKRGAHDGPPHGYCRPLRLAGLSRRRRRRAAHVRVGDVRTRAPVARGVGEAGGVRGEAIAETPPGRNSTERAVEHTRLRAVRDVERGGADAGIWIHRLAQHKRGGEVAVARPRGRRTAAVVIGAGCSRRIAAHLEAGGRGRLPGRIQVPRLAAVAHARSRNASLVDIHQLGPTGGEGQGEVAARVSYAARACERLRLARGAIRTGVGSVDDGESDGCTGGAGASRIRAAADLHRVRGAVLYGRVLVERIAAPVLHQSAVLAELELRCAVRAASGYGRIDRRGENRLACNGGQVGTEHVALQVGHLELRESPLVGGR